MRNLAKFERSILKTQGIEVKTPEEEKKAEKDDLQAIIIIASRTSPEIDSNITPTLILQNQSQFEQSK